MRRSWAWLIVVLVAFGLATSGCGLLGGGGGEEKKAENTSAEKKSEEKEEAKDEEKDEEKEEEKDEEKDEKKEEGEDEKKEEGEDEKKEEGEDEKKEEGEEKAEGEEKKEEGEEKAEEALPSREDYIEAAVAVGCNDLDTSLDAAARQDRRKNLLTEMGMTDDLYLKAQDKYKDDPTIKPVIEGRLKPDACRRTEEPTQVGDPDKKNVADVVHGTFKGTVTGPGVRGTIQLSLKPTKVSGNAKGTRDREKWNVGLSGTMRGATFSGNGNNKNTNLRLQGRVAGRKATGTLTGKINGKSASMNFTASR